MVEETIRVKFDFSRQNRHNRSRFRKFLGQIEVIPRLTLRRYSAGNRQNHRIKMAQIMQKWLGREFTELETTSFRSQS